MKRLFAVLLLSVALSIYANAQTDTTKHMYYYYPESNVYFDAQHSNYIYYDSTGSAWLTVKQLPSTSKWNKQQKRNAVFYKGTGVWIDNGDHRKKYSKKTPPQAGGQ